MNTKKVKVKKQKKDEENDVGKGNSDSACLNTERDIMLQDNETDLCKNSKDTNVDERMVNICKAPDKVDKMDQCNTSEERMCENEDKCEKKHGRDDEVKEKNKNHNGECMDRGMLSTEIGERNINDKDEMPGNRGNGNNRKVDSKGKNDEDKGNIFENMKRKSKGNVGVECVDNNDTDMEEKFEESVTYVDSQKLKVDDSIMKEDDSVMNSVQLDHEYSPGSGIVQIPTVQNTEVIVEETGSNNNKDIVSESLIDGEIINEIKINDKLRCEENIESEGSSDMEDTQNIKKRQKTNSSVYTVSRPKDVLMSGGIVDYGLIAMKKHVLIY